MVRVLHLLEATGGGTRRHVLDLLPALHERGIESELLFSPLRFPAFYSDAARLREAGVRTTALPMARGVAPGLDARALRDLIAHLRRHPPDVLHLHSFKAGLLGRLAVMALGRPIPVVYTPHCIAFDTGLPIGQRRVARAIETMLAPRTARFIAVSGGEASSIRRAHLAPTARIAHIPNGVDIGEFDLDPHRSPSGLNRLWIGCFGRLTAQKNQGLLIRALALLRRDGVDARLLLCGGGEDEAKLRALADRVGVGGCLIWTGEVSDARPLYRRCDVVAVPSRWESCPYAVLEAMAAGRAVVGSRVGGIPELLGTEAGKVQRERGAVAWAGALKSLLQDEKCRNALGVAARARVEREFTLDRMVDATIAVYEAVAKE